MIAATANILKELDNESAARALNKTLRNEPDLVAVQEWGRDRRDLLPDEYAWSGGMPIGVHPTWGDLLISRTVLVSRARGDARASRATEALILRGRRLHIVLNVHLLAHHDEPANLAGWREGIQWIEDWVAGIQRYQPKVQPWVMGDVNKHNLRIEGLTSCWKGNPLLPTFRERTIDGIWTNKKANAARVIKTPSDHHSALATY